MKTKSRNILNNTIWYHGTTISALKNIIEWGVQADYNKESELDYGYGFYLTHEFQKAQSFINQLFEATGINAENEVNDEEKAVVIEFHFEPLQYFEQADAYKTCLFEGYNRDFSEFVYNNRMFNRYGENQHEYDLIYGVMSDSLPVIIMAKHRAGELTKEEVLTELEKGTSFKQLSIHNQELCDTIKITKAYDAKSGEEIEIDGYIHTQRK